MNLYEKAAAIEDDVRQLAKILLDIGGDKAANIATAVNCYLIECRKAMQADGVGHVDWVPLPRDREPDSALQQPTGESK